MQTPAASPLPNPTPRPTMRAIAFHARNNRLVKLVFRTPWFGRYADFAAAEAAIPDRTRIGYNQHATTQVYRSYPIDRVRPADYAMMLHLQSILRRDDRLVDLGGSIGMMCYTAQKYFELPSGLRWTVCDVPAMLDAGRETALREGDRSAPLHFVDSLCKAGACRVFYSSGALQFIEKPLPLLLGQLPALPEHVLINRIPAWDGPAFATIHDIGFCLAPYQIFNRQEFIESMLNIGYKLADDWNCPESSFSLRFHPRIRLDAYRGFYFRLNRDSTASAPTA